MARDHEREDFVNADGSTYRSHFIVKEEDFDKEIMWISDHLVLDGRHFFRECCRNANGLWYVWVYLLGTQREAENYVYSIKIHSEDKEEELAYRGKVVSLDVPKEKLISLGSGLVFPDTTARHYWTNPKIHYSVAVISKKAMKKKTTNNQGDAASVLKTSESSSNLKQGNKGPGAIKEKAATITEKEKSTAASPSSASTSTTTGSGATPKTEAATSGSVTPSASASEDVRETPC